MYSTLLYSLYVGTATQAIKKNHINVSPKATFFYWSMICLSKVGIHIFIIYIQCNIHVSIYCYIFLLHQLILDLFYIYISFVKRHQFYLRTKLDSILTESFSIPFQSMPSFFFLFFFSNKFIFLGWLHQKKKISYVTTFQMHWAISIMLHNILYLSCLVIKKKYIDDKCLSWFILLFL